MRKAGAEPSFDTRRERRCGESVVLDGTEHGADVLLESLAGGVRVRPTGLERCLSGAAEAQVLVSNEELHEVTLEQATEHI